MDSASSAVSALAESAYAGTLDEDAHRVQEEVT